MPQNFQPETQEFQDEYRQIKSDVKNVLLINLLVLLLLAGLAFANRQFGWLNFLYDLF